MRGLSILCDDAVGSARRERFRAFITPHVEARKTALFTLGVYRRGASQQVLDDFVAVFRDYTIAIYEVRLDQYRHATMTVVGSIDSTARDVIVNARGDDPSLREPVSIGFRLTPSQDTFKIVDVQVAGIWLSMEQREQFTALLGQNDGNVTALTDELRRRAARIRAGVPDPWRRTQPDADKCFDLRDHDHWARGKADQFV